MSRTRFRQRHFRSAEHITHRGKTQSFISGWTQHNERTRSADQMESGRRIVQTPDDLAGSTRAKHTQPESQAGAGDWSYLPSFHALSSSLLPQLHSPQPQGQGGPQAATEGSFLPHSDGTARHPFHGKVLPRPWLHAHAMHARPVHPRHC
jgi:hypothetical protein